MSRAIDNDDRLGVALAEHILLAGAARAISPATAVTDAAGGLLGSVSLAMIRQRAATSSSGKPT